MKTKPGGDPVMLERDVWGPIHKELIKAGVEYSWAMFQVAFPSDNWSEYDYVTVNYYTSMAQMDGAEDALEKAFEAAHPGKDWEEIAQLTEDTRDMVKREVYVRRDFVTGEKAGGTGKILTMNRMKLKPGQYDAYLKMEEEVAKPMHQQTIGSGVMDYWGVWEKVIPWGSRQAFDFVTAEEWEGMGAMEKMDWEASFEKAHPGKSMEKISEMIESTRTMVNGEVWYRAAEEVPQGN